MPGVNDGSRVPYSMLALIAGFVVGLDSSVVFAGRPTDSGKCVAKSIFGEGA